MALAPKFDPGPITRSRSSVKSAEGKAAQRARNKANGSVSRSGSSGTALKISTAPRRLWEEVEDDVTHLVDVAGKISHSQVGSSGYLIATLSVPLEYAHDLLDVHLKGRDGLVYIRVYHVSLEDYLGPIDDESDEGGEYRVNPADPLGPSRDAFQLEG